MKQILGYHSCSSIPKNNFHATVPEPENPDPKEVLVCCLNGALGMSIKAQIKYVDLGTSKHFSVDLGKN